MFLARRFTKPSRLPSHRPFAVVQPKSIGASLSFSKYTRQFSTTRSLLRDFDFAAVEASLTAQQIKRLVRTKEVHSEYASALSEFMARNFSNAPFGGVWIPLVTPTRTITAENAQSEQIIEMFEEKANEKTPMERGLGARINLEPTSEELVLNPAPRLPKRIEDLAAMELKRRADQKKKEERLKKEAEENSKKPAAPVAAPIPEPVKPMTPATLADLFTVGVPTTDVVSPVGEESVTSQLRALVEEGEIEDVDFSENAEDKVFRNIPKEHVQFESLYHWSDPAIHFDRNKTVIFMIEDDEISEFDLAFQGYSIEEGERMPGKSALADIDPELMDDEDVDYLEKKASKSFKELAREEKKNIQFFSRNSDPTEEELDNPQYNEYMERKELPNDADVDPENEVSLDELEEQAFMEEYKKTGLTRQDNIEWDDVLARVNAKRQREGKPLLEDPVKAIPLVNPQETNDDTNTNGRFTSIDDYDPVQDEEVVSAEVRNEFEKQWLSLKAQAAPRRFVVIDWKAATLTAVEYDDLLFSAAHTVPINHDWMIAFKRVRWPRMNFENIKLSALMDQAFFNEPVDLNDLKESFEQTEDSFIQHDSDERYVREEEREEDLAHQQVEEVEEDEVEDSANVPANEDEIDSSKPTVDAKDEDVTADKRRKRLFRSK